MYSLLLLEDDINLQETVAEYLEEEGFRVTAVSDGEAAQDAIYENAFDLLILDVNTPAMDGFTLLKSLRSEGKMTPAIFTTSRNAMVDLEEGFASGCDDYIRKPFALKELLLRIDTILKREFSHNDNPREPLGNGLFYDVKQSTLYHNETPLHLQEKEHRLLKLLLQHKNRAVTHEMIEQALWSFEETPSDTALRTYVKNLRKILGKECIVSLKRIGYQLSL